MDTLPLDLLLSRAIVNKNPVANPGFPNRRCQPQAGGGGASTHNLANFFSSENHMKMKIIESRELGARLPGNPRRSANDISTKI